MDFEEPRTLSAAVRIDSASQKTRAAAVSRDVAGQRRVRCACV
jgi:hypothetical protein